MKVLILLLALFASGLEANALTKQVDQSFNKCSKELEQKDCGIPPFASFEVDKRMGRAPLGIEFDASESFDEDGNIVSYEWDFGNGDQATGETVNYTFEQNGEFEVELTVTDNDQKIGRRTLTIKVDESAPIARLSWQESKIEMQEDAGQVVASLNLEPLQSPSLSFDLEFKLILQGSIDAERFSTPSLDVTIPAGQTSIDIPISLSDDNEVNGPQMLALLIDRASLPSGVEVEWPKVVEVTINDSDFEYRKECIGEPGENRINPDGEVGGFVADTAFVGEENIFLDSGVQICGNTSVFSPVSDELRIEDNVIVWDSTVEGETHLSGNAYVQTSELNDVTANSNAIIVRSALLDSQVLDDAQVFNILEPQFGTGAVGVLVENNAVLSTGFSEGSLIGANSCHLQGRARVYNTSLLAEDSDKSNCLVSEDALLLGQKQLGNAFANSIASSEVKMIGSFTSTVSFSTDPNSPLNQLSGRSLLYSSNSSISLGSGMRVDGNAEIRDSSLGEGVWAGGDVFISESTFCLGETLLEGEFIGVTDCPLESLVLPFRSEE